MQAKVGKKYDYYGYIPPKPRLRPDLKWDVSDKIDQYQWIDKINRLNFELERAKYESDLKEKKTILGDLEHKVKENQLKLNDLKTGQFQKVKSLLKERKEPVNEAKPPDEVMEYCECKLFDKKKALDRLRYEEEKLCKLYASRLVHLSEMQDRERYHDACQIAEEMKVKNLEYLLSSSAIQIQTFQNFLNDCESVIIRLSEESLHYANTLNSLEHELNEQNQILNSINKMGQPAYESSLKNKKRLETMQKQTAKKASKRQATISSYKRNLLKNEQNIFKHLPKDEQFELMAPYRYVRETESVLDLRLHFEKVEHDTRQLCEAALCANTEDLSNTVDDIFSKLKAGEEKVTLLESKLSEMNDKLNRSKLTRTELKFSVTPEDIKVTNETNNVNAQIQLQMGMEQTVALKADDINNELFKIQFAMQHFIDLLKSVNGGFPMIRKEYPNDVLKLPLFELHLGFYPDQTEPPEVIEEDIEKLFAAVTDRITPLIQEYAQVRLTTKFTEDCNKRHQELVLQEIFDDSTKT